jgi:hypothetical protein
MSFFLLTERLAERCAQLLNEARVVKQPGDEDLPALVGRRVGELIVAVRACAIVVSEEFLLLAVDACAAGELPAAALAAAAFVVERFGECAPDTLYEQTSPLWNVLETEMRDRTLTDAVHAIDAHIEQARDAASTCLRALRAQTGPIHDDLFEKVDPPQ